MKNKKQIKPPELIIERVLWDSKTGRVSAVDLHDESTGMAYYCEVTDAHYHGFKKPVSRANKRKKV